MCGQADGPVCLISAQAVKGNNATHAPGAPCAGDILAHHLAGIGRNQGVHLISGAPGLNPHLVLLGFKSLYRQLGIKCKRSFGACHQCCRILLGECLAVIFQAYGVAINRLGIFGICHTRYRHHSAIRCVGSHVNLYICINLLPHVYIIDIQTTHIVAIVDKSQSDGLALIGA